jgi:hypothetical protein
MGGGGSMDGNIKWLMRVTETWAAMHEMGLGPDVIFAWN